MKKGQMAIMLVFIILAVVMVLITAVFAPMGVLFTSKMVAAGEDIMTLANDSIMDIKNDTIRQSILDMQTNAMAAADTNIEVNSTLFQYGWIFVLGITLVVIFLISRALVEYSRMGGGIF